MINVNWNAEARLIFAGNRPSYSDTLKNCLGFWSKYLPPARKSDCVITLAEPVDNKYVLELPDIKLLIEIAIQDTAKHRTGTATSS